MSAWCRIKYAILFSNSHLRKRKMANVHCSHPPPWPEKIESFTFVFVKLFFLIKKVWTGSRNVEYVFLLLPTEHCMHSTLCGAHLYFYHAIFWRNFSIPFRILVWHSHRISAYICFVLLGIVCASFVVVVSLWTCVGLYTTELGILYTVVHSIIVFSFFCFKSDSERDNCISRCLCRCVY